MKYTKQNTMHDVQEKNIKSEISKFHEEATPIFQSSNSTPMDDNEVIRRSNNNNRYFANQKNKDLQTKPEVFSA